MEPIKNDQMIRDAQYRKGQSIAFFNATNAAIEMWKLERSYATAEECKPENVHSFVKMWRDWFLSEHKDYYAREILTTGTNYNATDTIMQLRGIKTYREFKKFYFEMSEDERRDGSIRAVVDELNAKFKNENAQNGAAVA